MEKQTKKVYKAPSLTIATFKVEQGFNASKQSLSGFWDGDNRHNANPYGNGVEDYTQETNSENGGYWQW